MRNSVNWKASPSKGFYLWPTVIALMALGIVGLIIGSFIAVALALIAIKQFTLGIILAFFLAVIFGHFFGKCQCAVAWASSWKIALTLPSGFSFGFILPALFFTKFEILTQNLPFVLILLLGTPLATCFWLNYFNRKKKKPN